MVAPAVAATVVMVAVAAVMRKRVLIFYVLHEKLCFRKN